MEILGEEWVKITRCESDQSVMPRISETAKTKKVLTGSVDEQGYRRTHLGRGTPNMRIHQLIAEVFIGGCLPGYEINHRDGNKQNNVVTNLEVVTHQENISHAWKLGLVDIRGEKHPNAKLTPDIIIGIRQQCAAGESCRKIAQHFGIHARTVLKIKNRERWAHVA